MLRRKGLELEVEVFLTGYEGGRSEIRAVMSNGFGIDETSYLSSDKVTTPQLGLMYGVLHADMLAQVINV